MARLRDLYRDFTTSERSAGFVLIGITIASLLVTNLWLGESVTQFFHSKIGFSNDFIDLKLSIEHWVNDGLMAIFFLLVGLEIEREMYIGELSSPSRASLPVIAAIGGMMVPFLIHYLLNYGSDTQNGGGIPMATDIAFALGVLALAKRVPHSLKIFLTAFAIIDDLGAILVIAIFYTETIAAAYLGVGIGLLVLLFILNRFRVHNLWFYLVPGIIIWYCFLKSGVHATISGVLLALVIPFGDGTKDSPSFRLQHILHKPVAFIILPIFAIVNTCIVIGAGWIDGLFTNNSIGIILGLVVGKPLGIFLFCYLAVKLGIGKLPARVSWGQLFAVGILGGIGFTMSIFISLLAFGQEEFVVQSKIAILVASLIASIAGVIVMNISTRSKERKKAASVLSEE